MDKLRDALGALLVVGGIITAWVIIPIIAIVAVTGLLLIFFYKVFQEDRDIKAKKKADNQANSTDPAD